MSYDQYSQGPTPAQPLTTSPWAIVSLISGIASFFFLPLIGAVLALIGGYSAKNEIRRSAGRIGGNGLATWGIVLGWLNITLGLLTLCLVILMVTGVIGLGGLAACGPFSDWINQLNY